MYSLLIMSKGIVDLIVVKNEAGLLKAARSNVSRADSIKILQGILQEEGYESIDLEHGLILTQGQVEFMTRFPAEGFERDQVGYWMKLWYGAGYCPTPCKTFNKPHNGMQETSTPQDSDLLSTFGVRMSYYQREKTDDKNYRVFTLERFVDGVQRKLEHLDYEVQRVQAQAIAQQR